jgi:endonuclease YncB( thermonuclease family)
LALVGFIAGSAATLAVVAIGLGGQVKPRTYTGLVPERTLDGDLSAYDGDTFSLGEVSLRLWGVDAPELHQECRGNGVMVACGDSARQALHNLVVGHTVQCDRTRSLDTGQAETFGRPLVRCWVLRDGARRDVGAELIRDGYAIPYRNDHRYDYDDEAREGEGHNVMAYCSLRPDVWRSRRGRQARAAFEQGGVPASEQKMGDCAGEPGQ